MEQETQGHVGRATAIIRCTGINVEKGDGTSRHSLGSLTPRVFQVSKQFRSHVLDLICICTPVSQATIACSHKYNSYCRALLRFVEARCRLCHISLDIWKPCMGSVWMISGWFHHFPMKALIVPELHVFVEFRQLQWGRGRLSVTLLMSLCMWTLENGIYTSGPPYYGEGRFIAS